MQYHRRWWMWTGVLVRTRRLRGSRQRNEKKPIEFSIGDICLRYCDRMGHEMFDLWRCRRALSHRRTAASTPLGPHQPTDTQARAGVQVIRNLNVKSMASDGTLSVSTARNNVLPLSNKYRHFSESRLFRRCDDCRPNGRRTEPVQ